MREYSTAQQVSVPTTGNLTDDVVTNGTEYADVVVFSRRAGSDAWADVTAGEFLEEVRAVAKGLIAAGIEAGDRVALISRTRYEWTLLDYAIWFAGAATVPVYETSSAAQVEWILEDSGARAAFVETAEHGSRVKEVARQPPRAAPRLVDRRQRHRRADDARARRQRRAARGASYGDGAGRPRHPDLHLGHDRAPQGLHAHPRQLHVRAHRRHRRARHRCSRRPDEQGEGASTLLFLPLAHVFARIIQVGCVKARVRMGHSADIKNLLDDFAAFRPTFILAVPRVFEKVFNTASQRAVADGRGKIFDRAADVAIAWSRGLENGRHRARRPRPAPGLRPARLRQAAGGPRRPVRVRRVRRSAPR